MLSCRLTFGPLWLRIFLFLWWFLLALFGLFVLHWRYELPRQDKLPEFHYTSIVGCIRVSWLVLHPLGLELDKALFGWNSVMSFKKGIKREITAYPSLKDERYFDGFKRSLFIVSKTHESSEVLDPNYTPGSEPEEQELFEAKQTFMFSVFNTNLQTDMGKTIVRTHLASTDAQAVWKELSEHLRTSSKGA